MTFSSVLRSFVAVVVMTVVASMPCVAQQPDALLADVFQDHVVLQHDAPITVWGAASPGATVTVEMAGETAAAEARSDGAWSVELPAMTAGGPHTLKARSSGGADQSVSDVLVGDVFLCSGQSNMELPVSRSLNAPNEIRNAENDRIRMLTVERASSTVPLDTLPNTVAWERASPETVGDWSAVCYYFARELQQDVDVPFGLINSSWGGSSIRAWMSADALARVGGYDEMLSALRLYGEDERAAQQRFGERWETWWREQTDDAAGTVPWQPTSGAEWAPAPEGLGDWQDWPTADLRGFTGMAWFRSTFTLTAEQASQDAELSLGGIDEVDQTWINGEVVGNTFGWGTPRTYTIPAEMLQEGKNAVVVNVLNTWGSGGMVGDADERALVLDDGGRVPLVDWRYTKAPAEVGYPPRAPWESVAGLTTIHNAMVAPLHDYDLSAVLWYQGESDTGDGDEYQQLLEALMAQWRDQFGDDLPVLVVQLTNFGMPSTEPKESGWAEVREAQRRATVDDPNAAFAVAVDLGTPYDIHPANKQEVARRLARAARHVVYGEDIAPSGPVPTGATRQDAAVVVTFDDVTGSLVAYSHDAPIGFELCGSEEGSCRYADARIDGDRVHLQTEGERDVARVRYCWADGPVCTLYDEARLPATPFELHIAE